MQCPKDGYQTIKVPCAKKFGKAAGLDHGLFLRGEVLDLWARAGSGCVGDGQKAVG